MDSPMKPRFNRSAVKVVKGPIPRRHFAGSITPPPPSTWKSPSSDTYAKLAMSGSIKPEQIVRAFHDGKLTHQEFQDAFWSTCRRDRLGLAELLAIKRYEQILTAA